MLRTAWTSCSANSSSVILGAPAASEEPQIHGNKAISVQPTPAAPAPSKHRDEWSGQGKKDTPGHRSRRPSPRKGAGKGRGGSNQPRPAGRLGAIGYEFQKSGKRNRPNSKYAHRRSCRLTRHGPRVQKGEGVGKRRPDSKKAGSSGNATKGTPRRYWAKGTCRNGESCEFLHDLMVAPSERGEEGSLP